MPDCFETVYVSEAMISEAAIANMAGNNKTKKAAKKPKKKQKKAKKNQKKAKK